MKTSTPWSIKGIDPEARVAAKEAAKREGMTLGAWITQKIIEENSEDLAGEATVASAQRRKGKETKSRPTAIDVGAFAAALRDVAERTQNSERRSEDRVEALRKTLENIVGRVDSVSTRMSEVATAVQTMSGGLERTAERAERAEAEAAALRSDMTDASEQISEVRSQTGATVRAATALIEKVDALADQSPQATSGDDETKAALEALSARLDDITAASEAVSVKTEDAFERLVTRLDDVNDRQDRAATAIGDALEALTRRLEAVETAQQEQIEHHLAPPAAYDAHDAETHGSDRVENIFDEDPALEDDLTEFDVERGVSPADDDATAHEDVTDHDGAADHPARPDAIDEDLALQNQAESLEPWEAEASEDQIWEDDLETTEAPQDDYDHPVDSDFEAVSETDAAPERRVERPSLDALFKDIDDDAPTPDARASEQTVDRDRDYEGPPSLAALRARLRDSGAAAPKSSRANTAGPEQGETLAASLDSLKRMLPDRESEAVEATDHSADPHPLEDVEMVEIAETADVDDLFDDAQAIKAADVAEPHDEIESQDAFLRSQRETQPIEEDPLAQIEDLETVEEPKSRSLFARLKGRFAKRDKPKEHPGEPLDADDGLVDPMELDAFSEEAAAQFDHDLETDLWEEFETEEAPRTNRIVMLAVLGVIGAMLGAGFLYIYTAFNAVGGAG
ncbi:MAG: hypothetical protein AAFR28_04840 [Pseudomonadota bacterium]